MGLQVDVVQVDFLRKTFQEVLEFPKKVEGVKQKSSIREKEKRAQN